MFALLLLLFCVVSVVYGVAFVALLLLLLRVLSGRQPLKRQSLPAFDLPKCFVACSVVLLLCCWLVLFVLLLVRLCCCCCCCFFLFLLALLRFFLCLSCFCCRFLCRRPLKNPAVAYFGHDLLWPRPTLAMTYFGHDLLWPWPTLARPTLARPTLATTFNLANWGHGLADLLMASWFWWDQADFWPTDPRRQANPKSWRLDWHVSYLFPTRFCGSSLGSRISDLRGFCGSNKPLCVDIPHVLCWRHQVWDPGGHRQPKTLLSCPTCWDAIFLGYKMFYLGYNKTFLGKQRNFFWDAIFFFGDTTSFWLTKIPEHRSNYNKIKNNWQQIWKMKKKKYKKKQKICLIIFYFYFYFFLFEQYFDLIFFLLAFFQIFDFVIDFFSFFWFWGCFFLLFCFFDFLFWV